MCVHWYVLVFVIVIIVKIIVVVQYGMDRSFGIRTDGASAIDSRVTLDKLNECRQNILDKKRRGREKNLYLPLRSFRIILLFLYPRLDRLM